MTDTGDDWAGYYPPQTDPRGWPLHPRDAPTDPDGRQLYDRLAPAEGRVRHKKTHIPHRWTPFAALVIAITALFAAMVSGGAKSKPQVVQQVVQTRQPAVICVHGSRHLVTRLTLPVNGQCPGAVKFTLP